MNIYKNVVEIVKESLKDLMEEGYLTNDCNIEEVAIEIPKNKDHGDFAINAAMIFAKKLKKNPREIAEKMVQSLKTKDGIKNVSVAGPGFINIDIEDDLWNQVLQYVLENGDKYGISDIGKGKKINVEFLSANPTGPMHIGHSRGAIYGDAISTLLIKAGYNVTREYYVNDYGKQVGVLADSLYWRYEELFNKHEGENLPEGCYPGDYLIPVAKEINNKDGDKWLNASKEKWGDEFKKIAVASMMEIIKSNLVPLNINFDKFSSEKDLVETGEVNKVLELMSKKDLLYKGFLPKPEGQDIEDYEPEEQLLFKSSKFGDDFDRVIVRGDGTSTYFASDVAYHLDKFKRGFNHQIDVWGADHGGYIKRMSAALNAVTDGEASLEVKLCQMVNLEKDGKPFKMSKRAGTFVLVTDVLEEVDPDAFRLFILTKSVDTQVSFDLEKVKTHSKDNPVFYIQYAHVRCNSAIDKYAETFNEKIDKSELFKHFIYQDCSQKEKDLIKTMAQYPKIIEFSALNRAPNLLATYMEELATDFHSLWTVGAKKGDKMINQDDLKASKSKMAVVLGVKSILANGLETLGVTPKRRMEASARPENKTGLKKNSPHKEIGIGAS